MAGENINRRLNIYINDKEVVNSATGINKALNATRNQMRSLVKGSEDYDEKLKELQKTYAELKDRQEEFNDELNISNKEFGAARESALSFFGALASGDPAAAQAALLGMRGAIVSSTQAMWAFVATPLGGFLVGLAGIVGITKFWVDYNEEVYKANKLTNGITQLTGDNLDNVRVQAQTLAETFDQDFTKILESARTLVNEFGISYEEALLQLEEGLIKGGAANGEFLDSMREYPTFFAKAGFSVSQFQDIVNSGIDLGIYQDKLPDAIKEFTLSVNEQTKASSDALRNAFGEEFTNKLLGGIKKGTISAKDALFLVAEEAKRIGLNAQQAQQLTADLFRGAGEDAGGALKIFEAVRKSIADQTKPLNEVQQATADLVESEKELAQAQDEALKSDGYAKWKTNALIALNSVKKGFWNLVAAMTNSREELLAASEKKSIDRNTQDQIKNFEAYVELRKKSMGELFDFEKVREERIAAIKQSLSKAGAGSWDATPAQESQQKRLEAELSAVKNYQQKVTKVKNENNVADQDAAKKAAEEAAKQRAKELEAAKKHAEELIKQEQDLQKRLLDLKRASQDEKLGLINDDYEREKAIVNADFDRKLEDLKANVVKEQEEIAKIKTQLASSKTSSSDAAVLRKQLAERLEIQTIYNQMTVSSEQTRLMKLAALEQKYLQKSFQDQEAKNARELQNIQTRQTEELNAVKTLEDAKKVLQQYLSDDELSKVISLSAAKKEIKKQFLKEEYNLQVQNLNDIMAKARDVLGQTDEFGLELITGEERESVLKFLDDAAAKLAALGVKNPDAEKADLSSLSGIDVLGFTPEQWEQAFADLDTFDGKMKAIEATIAGVKNAFGIYFQFLEAGEKRQSQAAEAAHRKKLASLSTQLEKGYVTQEVYNARVAKADQELAKKKAELAYKQAKREKAMNIASILVNTAVGVSKAMAQGGFVLGVPWAGIIAALGAIQLGLAIAQPLPDKNGFYDGGFTGTGNPRGEAGPVHYNEYVVPQKVLFSDDPVVPNIVSYLEAKRTGKTINTPEDETNPSGTATSTTSDSSLLTVAVVKALDRNSEILEKVEENGLIAYVENDIKTARKIRDKIKEANKLDTNAKA